VFVCAYMCVHACCVCVCVPVACMHTRCVHSCLCVFVCMYVCVCVCVIYSTLSRSDALRSSNDSENGELVSRVICGAFSVYCVAIPLLAVKQQ